jgi:hypothetical protein
MIAVVVPLVLLLESGVIFDVDPKTIGRFAKKRDRLDSIS